MTYNLTHIGLLVAATLVVWIVRSRAWLLVLAFLICPLPAALFNFFEAPLPREALRLDESNKFVVDGCGDQPRSAAAENPSTKQGEDSRAAADCEASIRSVRKQALILVLAVNYLAVLIGLIAGFLARLSLRKAAGER